MKLYHESIGPDMTPPNPALIRLAVPATIVLLLAGCAGFDNYVQSTVSPFGNPNAPTGDTLNMQRARGDVVATVQPITSRQGTLWPGPVKPVPTLGQIEQSMNAPLGTTNSAPVVPSHLRNGLNPKANFVTHSSTPPAPDQSGVTVTPQNPIPAPIVPPPVGPNAPHFQTGQTVIGPNGAAGIVTGNSSGRYQTVAPLGGKGGGILIPNGDGTASLIGPDGQITTVQQGHR